MSHHKKLFVSPGEAWWSCAETMRSDYSLVFERSKKLQFVDPIVRISLSHTKFGARSTEIGRFYSCRWLLFQHLLILFISRRRPKERRCARRGFNCERILLHGRESWISLLIAYLINRFTFTRSDPYGGQRWRSYLAKLGRLVSISNILVFVLLLLSR